MLQVDIRELARGPVNTVGELAANDPLFTGLDFVLAGPVHTLRPQSGRSCFSRCRGTWYAERTVAGSVPGAGTT